MRLVDVNVLLYAVDESSPHHEGARRWLEEALSSAETFALSWSVLLAFVRLGTNPRVFASPLGLDEALDLVDSWLAQPNTTVVHPTDRHAVLLRELLGPLGTAGNLTTDAHLATLAIEHGAELYSADADFDRFPRLRRLNPLSRQAEG
ncbi:MAG: type II toxin-antitoxin system VapC family toxin [Gaiellaceae bacterium]